MATTDFYVRSTAFDLNAGSTNTDAPLVTYSNGAWVNGTGIFTPVSANPVTDGVTVGMFASIYTGSPSATGFVGRITAVSSATITVSLTAKSGTDPSTAASGMTCKVGGAMASLNQGFTFPSSAMTDAAGDVLWVNFVYGAGAWPTLSSGITTSTDGTIVYSGCTSTARDGGLATITGSATGTSFNLLTFGASAGYSIAYTVKNFIFNQNGNSGGADLVVGANSGYVKFTNCVFANSNGSGFNTGGFAYADLFICESYNNANYGYNGGNLKISNCIAHHNGGNGFNDMLAGFKCISAANTGIGFSSSYGGSKFSQCVAVGNTSDGFNLFSPFVGSVDNCIISQNGGYGINVQSSNNTTLDVYNCAFYSNSSGQINIPVGADVNSVGTITCASNPLPNASTGNFVTNLAALYGTGFGAYTETYSGYTTPTTAYPDVGLQHQQFCGGDDGGPTVTQSNWW